MRDWDGNVKCFHRSKRPFFGKLHGQRVTDNTKAFAGRVFEYTTSDEPDRWKLAMCTGDPNVHVLLDAHQTVFNGAWHDLATGRGFRWTRQ